MRRREDLVRLKLLMGWMLEFGFDSKVVGEGWGWEKMDFWCFSWS